MFPVCVSVRLNNVKVEGPSLPPLYFLFLFRVIEIDRKGSPRLLLRLTPLSTTLEKYKVSLLSHRKITDVLNE